MIYAPNVAGVEWHGVMGGGWWKWWKCWLGHQSLGWEYIVSTGPCKYPAPGGNTPSTPDTLWCTQTCSYCLISPGSLYGVLSLSWIWDVEIDWGNLGLCLVQARQPSPLGHDWPQPPWAGMFLAHDQNWGEFPLTQWINYSPAQCSLAAYWL